MLSSNKWANRHRDGPGAQDFFIYVEDLNMLCKECGENIRPYSKYCHRCGHSQSVGTSIDVNIDETPIRLINRAKLFIPGLYMVFIILILLTMFVGVITLWMLLELISEGGRIPIGLFILFGFGIMVVMLALLIGFINTIYRRTSYEPALLINQEEESTLKEIINNLCREMNTQMPKSIIINSKPSFFVMEGKLRVINGTAKGRILSIGLPLLYVLTNSEFKAILAHEFAHFTGNDTKYSAKVYPVYSGTLSSLEILKQQTRFNSLGDLIFSTPMLIPRLVLDYYVLLFHKLNMEISRIREKRADYIAAIHCGTRVFSNALVKTATYSHHFYQFSIDYIKYHLERRKRIENLYNIFREHSSKITMDNRYLNKIINEKLETSFDSHYSLNTRLSYLPKINIKFVDNDIFCTNIKRINDYEHILTKSYINFIYW
jgi:Zn-dependent protease with chaperone function